MRIAVIGAALALAGCGSPPTSVTPEQIGQYPSNYKQLVANHIHERYFDPYSLRSVSISPPAQGYIPYAFQHEVGWIVCLRENGKNRMGAYTGITETVFVITHGSIKISDGDYPTNAICETANYQPWPEMEMAG